MGEKTLFSNELKPSSLQYQDTALNMNDSPSMEKRDCYETPGITTRVEGKQISTSPPPAEKDSAILLEDEKVSEHRRLFKIKLEEKIQQSKGQISILSKEKYNDIINVLLKWNEYTVLEKKKIGYRLAQKYYVLSLEGKSVELFWKKSKNISNDERNAHERVLHKENIFEAIRKIHEEAIHVKGRTLTHRFREMYGKSIPQWTLKLFTDLCPHCIEMREVRKYQIAGHKPILSNQFGERGQADLIDYQSLEFNGYKYLLVYQDHCTKFVECCALKNKKKRTTSRALIDIFTSLGAPRILHTDNGKEFDGLAFDVPLAQWDLNEVVDEIALLWPGCKMVHGSPRHSQSQGSVERANRKFREQIRSWLLTNSKNSCQGDWPAASMFVKYNINTSYHSGLKQTPYKLVFGQRPICGINGLPLLSDEFSKTIRTESDLCKFYNAEEDGDLSQINIAPKSLLRSMESTTKSVLFTASSENPLLRESNDNLIPEKTKMNILLDEKCDDHLQPACDLVGELDFNAPSSNSQVLKILHDEELDVTEDRRKIREKSNKAKEKQAEIMRKRAEKSQGGQGNLIPGTVCKININDFERLKADATTLTVTVVEVTQGGMYRLACKDGVLNRCFNRSNIVVLPESTVQLVGLSRMLEQWQTAKRISLRTAAKLKSVRMNLRMKCSCQSSCESNRCCCRKNGFLCTSSCHPGNSQCKNKERENPKESEASQGVSVPGLHNDAISKIEIEEFIPKETYKFSLPKLAWAKRCTTNVFSEQAEKEISKGSMIYVFESPNFPWRAFSIISVAEKTGIAVVQNDEGKIFSIHLRSKSVLWRNKHKNEPGPRPSWKIPPALKKLHREKIKICELNPLLRIKVASGDFINSKDYLRLKKECWLDDTVIESFLKAIARKSTHTHNYRFAVLGSQLWKYVKKGEHSKLSGVIHGLPLYNVDFFLTSLNYNEVHWLICLANISDRTFTIIDPYDPACSQVHKVSDEIETGLKVITKEYDDYMKVTKVWKGIASNKISKELNLPQQSKSNGSDCGVLACCYGWAILTGIPWPDEPRKTRKSNDILSEFRDYIGGILIEHDGQLLLN